MPCFLREQGGYSDEGIARKLHFDTVEDMRAQLRLWVLPDWLVGGESQTNLTTAAVKNIDLDKIMDRVCQRSLPSIVDTVCRFNRYDGRCRWAKTPLLNPSGLRIPARSTSRRCSNHFSYGFRREILRTSPVGNSAKFVLTAFYEVRIAPIQHLWAPRVEIAERFRTTF
jgi:hypothetical protein